MPNPIATIDTITTVLTFILLISNFILMVVMWVDKAKTPEKNQNARLLKLEDSVDELFSRLDKEKSHIRELEKSNTITQESLLALLGHAKDGNNTKQVAEAEEHLQKYLTHKGVTFNEE